MPPRAGRQTGRRPLGSHAWRRDIVDLNRLLLHPEAGLGAQRIEDWFQPAFFNSNFWLMWATMFSFQPWYSLVELRRYLRRFIHLFPGFTWIVGILRTRYNQYDSVIDPIMTWLLARGVRIETGTRITDVTIEGTRQGRRVTALTLNDGDTIEVSPVDCVYLTLGSMTDGSVLGSNDRAPGTFGENWPHSTKALATRRCSAATAAGPAGIPLPSR